jgi:hypothetical protein
VEPMTSDTEVPACMPRWLEPETFRHPLSMTSVAHCQRFTQAINPSATVNMLTAARP